MFVPACILDSVLRLFKIVMLLNLFARISISGIVVEQKKRKISTKVH